MENKFGLRLQELMKEKGYKLQDIAKAVNVSQMAVSYWIRGLRQPTADNILALSKFLGVSADYLLGLTDY